MPTSQGPTSKSVTTQALLLRRFELMAAEHVARIGSRIAKRRQELGLTQRELADLIPGKADSNQVSKWERAEHKASDNTLEHIAKALKVDPSYFHIAEPRPGTADLMATLESVSQLDRIESKLNQLLEQLGDTSLADLTAQIRALGNQDAGATDGQAPSTGAASRKRRAS